jgi:ferredoxin-like protein FixX
VGSKRLDDIAALARYQLDLQVKCRKCRHRAILNSQEVMSACPGSIYDRSLVAIRRRLRCTNCGSRYIEAGPCFREPL